MRSTSSFSFLRQVLTVDAVGSGAIGLGLWLFAPAFGSLLNLPVELLREVGLILLPFAALVGFIASRQHPSRIGVWIVIAINALWVLDSIFLLFADDIEPNVLGYAFLIVQAVAVGVIAELEFIGLRRASQAVMA